VLAVVARLNREQGVTVVAITHFMEEALAADRIIIMDEGRIVLEGTPRDLFAQPQRLRDLHLDVPQVAQVAAELHARVPGFPAGLLSGDEIVAAVKELAGADALPPAALPAPAAPTAADAPDGDGAVIEVTDLVHYYMHGTPLEVQALFGVEMQVQRGEVIGIIGHTGSGKSTLLQHLNGLLRPDGGHVRVLGQETGDVATDLRAIRRRVGLVFQFPEAQLFEQYVGDDVAFGPRKLGLDREQVRARVRKAMASVELGFEEYKDRMAIQLSGGQRRRVALAGVLALEPEVLVLDEPTAGLDPQGRRHLLGNILTLNAQGVTLIIVSHNMEELAEVCDRIYVLAEGRTVMEGSPAQVFGSGVALRAQGLDVPAITQLAEALAEAGLLPPGTITTRAALVEAVAALVGKTIED
jgi:energy-coupling factor transport system ATP-binding protein